MKKLALIVALLVLLPTAQAAGMTEDQKTLYTLGMVVGQQTVSSFKMSRAEFEAFKKGLTDAVTGAKPAVAMEVYGPKIQDLAQARRAALGEKALSAGKAFAEKAAKEPGAVKTGSGLVFLSLKEGTGASPSATDIVKVHYSGKLIDGKEFDSSYKRGEPAEFPLNGVVKCWTEGVAKMKIGGKAKLTCPPAIAYGEQGTPGGPIPPNATLSFEVELLSISKAPAEKVQDKTESKK